MGLIRFAVHPPDRLVDWPEVHRGYLAGSDGRIFPTRIELEQNIIGCRRSSSESSRFQVAWPVPGFGMPIVSTSSLSERAEPFLLSVELARGKLVQLRNQASTWELAGMRLPEEFVPASRRAHLFFARAASSQSDPVGASALAEQALEHSFIAADILTRAYSRQALAGRTQRYSQLPAVLGCHLPDYVLPPAETQEFGLSFDAAAVPLNWRTVEESEGEYRWDLFDQQVSWCEQNRLMILGSPLVDFGASGLPPWLARWEHDFFNLQSFVCDFVETAVARYQGRIRLWEIAARANTGGALALAEESRLTLVARMLDVARQVDEEARLIVRVDQPWGEYLARGQHRLSPLQMVDALLRSGVGLAGVHLEVAMGYLPRGSARRDLLDVSRLLDQWSVLGIPLYVTLAAPSSLVHDAAAGFDWEIDPHVWETADTESEQARWFGELLPLLMAKPAVAGVFWSQWSDVVSHELPRAGILREDGAAKPLLDRIRNFEQDCNLPAS